MTRRHDALVRLLARLLRAAGYQVDLDGDGTWEPRWNRPDNDREGQQKRDAEGNLLWHRARLDLRLEGGPEEPTTYGDVVVSHPRAESWVTAAAAADGASAREAARRKRVKYPEDKVPGAKLIPFAVEAGGRWDKDATHFLWAGCAEAPGLGGPRGQGGRRGVCQLARAAVVRLAKGECCLPALGRRGGAVPGTGGAS